MVYPIAPSESKGMQESAEQFLAGLAQLAQKPFQKKDKVKSAQAPFPSEDFRIQMGRRVVYGQIANGDFRNELDSTKLKIIFEALKQPVTEGIDPSQYTKRLPDIEVRAGDEVLFRRERDGTVTANQVQVQSAQQQVDQSVVEEQTPYNQIQVDQPVEQEFYSELVPEPTTSAAPQASLDTNSTEIGEEPLSESAKRETSAALREWREIAEFLDKPEAYVQRIAELETTFNTALNPSPLSEKAVAAMQQDLRQYEQITKLKEVEPSFNSPGVNSDVEQSLNANNPNLAEDSLTQLTDQQANQQTNQLENLQQQAPLKLAEPLEAVLFSTPELQAAQQMKIAAMAAIEQAGQNPEWLRKQGDQTLVTGINQQDGKLSYTGVTRSPDGTLSVLHEPSGIRAFEDYAAIYGRINKVLEVDSNGQIRHFDPENANSVLSELQALARGETSQERENLLSASSLDVGRQGLTEEVKLGIRDWQDAHLLQDMATTLVKQQGERREAGMFAQSGSFEVFKSDDGALNVTGNGNLVLQADPAGKIIAVDADRLESAVFQVGSVVLGNSLKQQRQEERQVSAVKDLVGQQAQTQPSYEVHKENVGAVPVAWEPPQNRSLGKQTARTEAPPKVGASVIAQQEVNKLPQGSTKQLLAALGSELVSQAQEMGQRTANWLASLPEAKRNQDVARTALNLFDDNYKKTGETTYQAENYTISLKGMNNYVVSDRQGEQIMRFKKGVLGLKVLSADMMMPHYQDFEYARRQFSQFGQDSISSDPAKRLSQLGNLAPKNDRETVNAFKTKELMNTAKNFLKNMGVNSWNPESATYSIEGQGKDYLRITSKTDGRGTVLLLENGKLAANLDSKDFSFFRKVEKTMNQHLQQQVQKAQSKPQRAGIQLV